MKKKIILVVMSLILAVSLLVGCTESYKAKAISTEYSAEVSSNGGLAVTYGKYLYYINGYAGNTIDNTFGDVTKGAIARVELDSKGNAIADTNTIIVSKNVYNTVATSGLYIVGDYIYYSTPSIDKDSTGTAKNASMWIMRTKVDGTGTEVIKKFDDYTAVYKVAKNHIIYYLKNEIHVIDLNDKNFEDTMIDEEVTAIYMTEYLDGANELIDTVFYLKANEDTTVTSNVVWAYRAGGKATKLIDASKVSYPSIDSRVKGYTIALVEANYTANGINLIYTKTDSTTNATSAGTYSYTFSTANVSEELSFNSAKEVRYSLLTNYTEFYFLSDTQALVLADTNYSLLTKTGSDWTKTSPVALINMEKAPEIFKVNQTDTSVEVYYTSGSVVYKIAVLEKDSTTGNYVKNILPAESVYAGGYSTKWLSYDCIGDKIYFFNESVGSNTYYVDLAKVVNRDADTQQAQLLGIISEAEEVTLLTATKETAE